MKIPITIITGYLGSGKTTLLNKILQQNHGRKIAVIENEFGEINLDYEFVLHEKENIFEMTNGCICCNVREDLVTTLKQIVNLDQKFDTVVIETTGVADPSPVLHTLKQDPELRSLFYVDSILCVVDAKNIHQQMDRSPEVKKQLTAAQLVLINKKDLVPTEDFIELENFLKRYNPLAEFVVSQYGDVPLEQIFLRNLFSTSKSVPKLVQAGKSMAPALSTKPKAEHEENIQTKYFEFAGAIDPNYFTIWIDILFFQFSANLYRMKGILQFKNEPKKVVFQSIHDYAEITKTEDWGDETPMNKFVVIGKDIDFNIIESGLKNCIK